MRKTVIRRERRSCLRTRSLYTEPSEGKKNNGEVSRQNLDFYCDYYIFGKKAVGVPKNSRRQKVIFAENSGFVLHGKKYCETGIAGSS